MSAGKEQDKKVVHTTGFTVNGGSMECELRMPLWVTDRNARNTGGRSTVVYSERNWHCDGTMMDHRIWMVFELKIMTHLNESGAFKEHVMGINELWF